MSGPYDLAVIGGGAAGQMAALRAVLNRNRTLLFIGDLDAKRRSRAQWVASIDNIPGLIGKTHPLTHGTHEALEWVAGQEHLRDLLTVVKRSVHTLARDGDDFALSYTEKHRRDPVGTEYTVHARHVVLATGIMDVQPHIQGSIEHIFSFANARQVLYCVRSDGHLVLGKHTVVIGHTSEAAWTAITLVERYAPPSMTLLTHGQPFAGDDEVRRLLAHYAIPIVEDEIREVVGTARKEGLQGFQVDARLIVAERAFVALGTLVYNELALQVGAQVDEHGYVVADARGETTVPNLFVAGDLRAGGLKQVYSSWDQAVAAVDHIDQRLRLARRPDLRER